MSIDESKMSLPGYWNERARRIDEPTHVTATERRDYLQRLMGGCSMSDPRYSELAAEEAVLFQAEWTAEITAARRAEWNTWVRTQGAKIPAVKVNAKVAKLGWSLNDLQRAVKLYA